MFHLSLFPMLSCPADSYLHCCSNNSDRRPTLQCQMIFLLNFHLPFLVVNLLLLQLSPVQNSTETIYMQMKVLCNMQYAVIDLSFNFRGLPSNTVVFLYTSRFPSVSGVCITERRLDVKRSFFSIKLFNRCSSFLVFMFSHLDPR